MVEWFSYGLEFLLTVISGLLVGMVLYRYKEKGKQAAEEQEDTESWYADTVECSQCIQQIKDNWEERSIPQHTETQQKIERIAENLLSLQTKGEQFDVDDSTLALVQETAEKCREVTRINTRLHAVGISSEIRAANKSAEELEQSARERL